MSGWIVLSQAGGAGTVDGSAGQPDSTVAAVATGINCLLSFSGATTSWTWAVTGGVTINASSPYSGRSAAVQFSSPGPYKISFTDSGSVIYTLIVWARKVLSPNVTGGTSRIDLRDWGSSNCNYQSAANGKWYADAALAIEADDDAWKLQASIDYLYLHGGGTVVVSRGNWYWKTIQWRYGASDHNEFTIPRSGVHIQGDKGNYVRLTAGLNTVANGGWGAICGKLDGTVVNDASMRGIHADCNSKFNQFPGAAYGGVANAHNSMFVIEAGDQVAFEDNTSENRAGIFGVLFGTYGFPNLLTNARIINNRFLHEGDDINIGDCSIIAAGATNYTISGNIIDSGNNLAFPTWNNSSAIEAHGTNYTVCNNIERNCVRLLNLAGDSQNADKLNIYGNVATGSPLGITLFELGAHTISNMDIHGNIFSLVPGNAPGAEAGIDTAVWSILGISDGNGFVNCKIYDNEIRLIGAPTSGHGNSVGIRMLGNMQNVEIYGNTISGFADFGIAVGSTRFVSATCVANAGADTVTCDTNEAVGQIVRFHNVGGGLPGGLAESTQYYVRSKPTATTATLSATSGGSLLDITSAGTGTQYIIRNWINGLHVIGNYVQNSGTLGVSVAGLQEIIANFQNLVVKDNLIVDETGASLQYGVWISAFSDTSAIVWNNNAVGYTTGLQAFDTASFPSAGQMLQSQVYKTLTTQLPSVVTDATVGFPSVVLQNATAATGGVANQNSPQLLFLGTAWDGAASKIVQLAVQLSADVTTPSAIFGIKVGSAAFQPMFRMTRTVASSRTSTDNGAGAAAYTANAGTPEAAIVGSPGDVCADTTNGEIYVKVTGSTTNTGWKKVTHA
jgi:hypothetical protein